MAHDMDVQEYSSSPRKLVRCFRASRDGWKKKCQKAKQANKLLKNQVRAVEHSREQWRRQAADLQLRVAELNAEVSKNR